MKLSLLLVGISFIVAGMAGASTLRTNAVSQPVVDLLHTAFLGANTLGMAEGIAGGFQYQSPIPADVQALANQLQGSCAIAQANNGTQTINGANCPISDSSSSNGSGDQQSFAYQETDSFQVGDANLRNQLSIVSGATSVKGTQTQTSPTTFSSNDTGHTEILTVANHKISVDYTMIYSGTDSTAPNGQTNFVVEQMNVTGTLSLDGQTHTGSLVANASPQTYTCAVDGAPIDCQTFTYIFGFVAPTMNVHR